MHVEYQNQCNISYNTIISNLIKHVVDCIFNYVSKCPHCLLVVEKYAMNIMKCLTSDTPQGTIYRGSITT